MAMPEVPNQPAMMLVTEGISADWHKCPRCDATFAVFLMLPVGDDGEYPCWGQIPNFCYMCGKAMFIEKGGKQ